MKSIVVTTRHPDFANDFEVFDSEADEIGVSIIDVDLGSSFDGKPDDHDQWVEWAESMLAEITDLPAHHGARWSVEGTIQRAHPDELADAPKLFIEWLTELKLDAVSTDDAAHIAGMLRLFASDPRSLFIELDERPGQFDSGYASNDWHWKLRQARNDAGNRFFDLI